MWIRDISRTYIPSFFCDLSFLAHYFNSFAARTSRWLEYVHVFIARSFSVDTELTIIIWEDVCFRTKTVLVRTTLEHSRSSLNVLPHQVFSPQLETVWEMINLLIFRCIFQHFWLADTCPNDIPFPTVRRTYSYSSSFHCIYNRVVNMSWIVNLETKSHIFI